VKYSKIPASKNFSELQLMSDGSFGLLYSKYYPKSKARRINKFTLELLRAH
jgi:hypothetical protein